MSLDTISTSTVREALRAIRYARPLGDSPLTSLDLCSQYLLEEGIADSRQSRAWALQQSIGQAVGQKLAEVRGAGADTTPDPTGELELQRLQRDLRSGPAGRRDWALLEARFLSPTHHSVSTLAATLGVTERTIQNWLTRGIEALTRLLREQEAESTRRQSASRGYSPRDRIVVSDHAEARTVVELLGEILSAIRNQKRIVRVSPEQLVAVSQYPTAENVAYRVGRIADWSQPRYRLDERFVEMSLLIDLGEETLSGRWRAKEERFKNLRDALAASGAPAVVLLGPPGSGKSTLLRRLEFDLAIEALAPQQDNGSIPLTFLVSLNQYRAHHSGEAPPEPIDWLAERWATRFPKLAPLAEIMAETPYLFLLDGLNEMPHRSASGYRDRIGLWKQFIHDTLGGGNGHRAVFTCRTLDLSAPLSSPAIRVPQVQLEPLSNAAVARFLGRYAPEFADHLFSALRGAGYLDAVRWPFFLRLVAEGATEGGREAGGPAALFTAYVRRAVVREMERNNPRLEIEGLFEQRDYERVASGREWRDPYELPTRGTLVHSLSDLAYGMQTKTIDGESSQVRIGFDDAIELIGGAVPEAIIQVGQDLGVLDEDRTADELLFQHQLLQEHFAARKLAVQLDPDLLQQEWRAARIQPSVDEVIAGLDPADPLPFLPATGWEETALQAAAMANNPAAFIAQIMDVNLALAGRAAHMPDVLPRLPGPLLDELRWTLVARSRDPEADLRDRIACGHAVGDLGDPRFERHEGPFGPFLLPPVVDIPAGTYPIGEDEPIAWAEGSSIAHAPGHEVSIEAFAIGQFPITNAEWACFLDAGAYEDDRWWDTKLGRSWRRGENDDTSIHLSIKESLRRLRANPEIAQVRMANGTWTQQTFRTWQARLRMTPAELEAHLHALYPGGPKVLPSWWGSADFNRPAQPVVGINWYEMRAYCAWLSAQTGQRFRLPSEVELEAAIRGTEGRRFAYGNEPDPMCGNITDTHLRAPAPIGVFPAGDSPEGACDLSGNVIELSSSAIGTDVDAQYGIPAGFPYPYDPLDGREEKEAPADLLRAGRGDSWNGPGFAAAFRNAARPVARWKSMGFRVVRGSA